MDGPARHLPVLGQAKHRGFRPAEVERRPRPAYAVWEFTLACDQRCAACGPRAAHRRPDELSTEEALDLVDALAELGVGEVTFIGGEAYLRKDLAEVISRARGHGMRATMTTGGRGLTEARLARLAEAGLQQVGYSIDGTPSVHDALRTRGSYARAMASMQAAKRLGLRVSANSQINRRSVGVLLPLAEVLLQAGIAGWQPILTIPHGNAADQPDLILQPYMLADAYAALERVLDLFDAHGVGVWPGNNLGYFGPLEHRLRRRQNPLAHYKGCQAGTSILGIESDGTIKACPTLAREGHSPGSVRDAPLRTLWERGSELRTASKRTVDDLWGYCRSCYYADACLGGCAATSEPLLGRAGNNPYCHHRVVELAAQGLRERVEPVAAADRRPFGHGQFRLITEPLQRESSP
ncbi:MAG: radical SAM protein [Myxococcota bacterium]